MCPHYLGEKDMCTLYICIMYKCVYYIQTNIYIVNIYIFIFHPGVKIRMKNPCLENSQADFPLVG